MDKETVHSPEEDVEVFKFSHVASKKFCFNLLHLIAMTMPASEAEYLDCVEQKDQSLGQKIEIFYLTYRNAEENLNEFMISARELENHSPNAGIGESEDVFAEIVADCQKKAAQIIRAPFVDSVRGIITTIRKKLVSKVSLDTESSAQHGQRHLNFLLELLGTWSNMVDQMRASHWSISITVFRLAISQLHDRVIEMALECFSKFREDKQLDRWHMRVMEASSVQGVSGGFSIIALDFLLSQMSSMRDIVQQYYRYIEDAFLSIIASKRYFEYTIKSDDISSDADNSETLIQIESAVSAEMEVMVTAQEKNRWRELDAVYIALEFGYIRNSIEEALSEPGLLEVEKGVFVPQAVEDVFFLMQRVVERALATGNQGSAFSVGNYIVEVLDPLQDSKVFELLSLRFAYRGCFVSQRIRLPEKHQNNNASDCNSAAKKSLPPPLLLLKDGSSAGGKGGGGPPISSNGSTICETSPPPSLPHSGSTSLLSGVASASLSGVNNWLKGFAEPQTAASSSSSSCDVTRSEVPNTGKGTDSIYRNGHGQSPLRKSASPPLSGTGTGSTIKTSTLESLLLHALDLNPDSEDGKDRISESTPLGLRDVGVHLTTLALAPSAILLLSHLFSPPSQSNNSKDSSSSNSSSSSSSSVKAEKSAPLNLISEELARCCVRYSQILRVEANALADDIFNKYVSPVLIACMAKPYNINGDAMERRAGDFDLLHQLRELMPSNASIDTQTHSEKKEVIATSNRSSSANLNGDQKARNLDKGGSNTDHTTSAEYADPVLAGCRIVRDLLANRMSSSARSEVLLQLAWVLNTHLLENLTRISFSEWGALLLNQEVLSIIRTFDDACDEAYFKSSIISKKCLPGVQNYPVLCSVKEAFAPLTWAFKILTLDQPADVRRYVIPMSVTGAGLSDCATPSPGLLTESKIRKIMACRTDFHRDAVQNVKISMK